MMVSTVLDIHGDDLRGVLFKRCCRVKGLSTSINWQEMLAGVLIFQLMPYPLVNTKHSKDPAIRMSKGDCCS